jgi:hypothetical protein
MGTVEPIPGESRIGERGLGKGRSLLSALLHPARRQEELGKAPEEVFP